jgi:hypothetical protein
MGWHTAVFEFVEVVAVIEGVKRLEGGGHGAWWLVMVVR